MMIHPKQVGETLGLNLLSICPRLDPELNFGARFY